MGKICRPSKLVSASIVGALALSVPKSKQPIQRHEVKNSIQKLISEEHLARNFSILELKNATEFAYFCKNIYGIKAFSFAQLKLVSNFCSESHASILYFFRVAEGLKKVNSPKSRRVMQFLTAHPEIQKIVDKTKGSREKVADLYYWRMRSRALKKMEKEKGRHLMGSP